MRGEGGGGESIKSKNVKGNNVALTDSEGREESGLHSEFGISQF